MAMRSAARQAIFSPPLGPRGLGPFLCGRSLPVAPRVEPCRASSSATAPAVEKHLPRAPMMDWTDNHYRTLARLISRHAWLYTEMVVAETVIAALGGASRATELPENRGSGRCRRADAEATPRVAGGEGGRRRPRRRGGGAAAPPCTTPAATSRRRHHDAHPAVGARHPSTTPCSGTTMRIPPSAHGRRSRDGDVGAGFLLVFVARDVAGEGEGRWRSSEPREHAEFGDEQSPVGAETVTERPRGAGSGLAPLERPNRLFDPSQALSVRLARLGLAPEAEQATKQTKFGPSEPWPGLATNQTHP
jgi:hypothetical protein